MIWIGLMVSIEGLVFTIPKTRHYILQLFPLLNVQRKNILEESQLKNPTRCEIAVSRLVNEIIDKINCFEIWGNEAETRDILRSFLEFYKSNPYTIELPKDIYYEHGDETGGVILKEDTLIKIYRLLKHRGLLWLDPHNDKTMLTEYGKSILDYLQRELDA